MTSTATWNLAADVELLANATDQDAADPNGTDPDAIDPDAVDLSPSPYEPPMDEVAEICLYRKRTINLLQRYAKLSIETGRLPSVLGGMGFRARISSYPLHTFEDAVIFVFDVERCLGELDKYEYEVLARVILRGEHPEQAAREIHCTSRSVYRTLPETLDKLTKKFLRREILSRSKISPKSCQGVKNGIFEVSS